MALKSFEQTFKDTTMFNQDKMDQAVFESFSMTEAANIHVPYSIGFTNIDNNEDPIWTIDSNNPKELFDRFFEIIENSYDHENYVIRIFFHNLSGYDSAHLSFFLHSSNKWEVDNTSRIGNLNKFRFLKITSKTTDCEIEFVDSMSFIGTSIEQVGKNYQKENAEYPKIERWCEKNGIESFKHMTGKQVFPYEYVNSFERYSQIHFPQYECFFSSMRGTNVNKADYDLAEKFVRDNKITFKTFCDFLFGLGR